MMSKSKQLGHDDESGSTFAREMLDGHTTAAINFDRLQKFGDQFIIFEYLLTEEDQYEKHNTTPFTSHPDHYWKYNPNKFPALWRAATKMGAWLYLVNYAKKGTRFENEIRLMFVRGLEEDKQHVIEDTYYFSRKAFQGWYQQLNDLCLSEIPKDKFPPYDGPYLYRKYNTKTRTLENYYHSTPACSFLQSYYRDPIIVRVTEDELKADISVVRCKACFTPNVPIGVTY